MNATEEEGESGENFGQRLARAVFRRRSQLVLGLDPDPRRLWPRALELEAAGGDPSASPSQRAARATAIHCTLAIEAAGEHCVAVKPQVACFERLGAAGWSALAEVVMRAREHGLLVIADAKRGDIDVSAEAYAQAFFGSVSTPYGEVESLRVDALTVNPLLGSDSLTPLLARARAAGGGLFVLVRTSNPGAADIQDLRVEGGDAVSERLARLVNRLGNGRDGGEGRSSSALGDVGAVVGATAPKWIARLRELMPSAAFLLPGIGAQGGRVEDLAPAFAPGPAGGLLTASRAIVRAHEGSGAEPAAAAEREASRLREQAWELAR